MESDRFQIREDVRVGHRGMALYAVLGLISLCLSLTGCSTIATRNYTLIPIDRFPAFALSEGSEIQPQSVDSSIPDVDILMLNDEMKTVLNESVAPLKNARARLEMLIKIIITRVKYESEIDDGAKSAREVFETRTGNCLSLSNLVVSMARYCGFKTDFQEIPIVPTWVKSGNELFFTRHIGALVNLDAVQEQDVRIDPSFGDTVKDVPNFFLFTPSLSNFRARMFNVLSMQPIPDNRAFGQYYNNIGAKYLVEGKNCDAFRYFIKAVKTDPGLGYAWSNLGVVYNRNNQTEAAERAYLRALSIGRNSDDACAMSAMGNLEKLYRKTGNKKQAAFYEKEVASFRDRNPYYHYSLGMTAYSDGNFKESVKQFKYAIRRKDNERIFHYALALAYLRLGDMEMAEKTIVHCKGDEILMRDYDLVWEEIIRESQ